jgi:hypothetical protein
MLGELARSSESAVSTKPPLAKPGDLCKVTGSPMFAQYSIWSLLVWKVCVMRRHWQMEIQIPAAVDRQLVWSYGSLFGHRLSCDFAPWFGPARPGDTYFAVPSFLAGLAVLCRIQRIGEPALHKSIDLAALDHSRTDRKVSLYCILFWKYGTGCRAVAIV